MKYRIFTFYILLCLSIILVIPTKAADTSFSDVVADAWYADAVEYVQGNNLMRGTTATTFEPDKTTSRAMLVTILYRNAGSPDPLRQPFPMFRTMLGIATPLAGPPLLAL